MTEEYIYELYITDYGSKELFRTFRDPVKLAESAHYLGKMGKSIEVVKREYQKYMED